MQISSTWRRLPERCCCMRVSACSAVCICILTAAAVGLQEVQALLLLLCAFAALHGAVLVLTDV